MSNQKNVLKILKENKDGLTIAELDALYEIEHGRKLGHSLYSYLHRLMNIEMVEAFIPKVRERKVIGYRTTDKAYEEDRKEEALEILKKMIKPFAENKITVVLEDSEKEIIEDLWGKINNE